MAGFILFTSLVLCVVWTKSHVIDDVCGSDPNARIGCGNPCGKTCASPNVNQSDLRCPQYCESNGCDCNEGYLLNIDVKPHKCVLAKDCPKPTHQCGKNEVFYCGYLVDESSCTYPEPAQRLSNKCEHKCFCKKGFVRDAHNACIPIDQCSKLCTKPHERYSSCLLGECKVKTCDGLGYPVSCASIIPPCEAGCTCEYGYVRDKDGQCIDEQTCPSCGGDPNAEAGCGNCVKTCASLKGGPKTSCNKSCAPGCKCKEGYILNTDLRPPRCVLPKDCNKQASPGQTTKHKLVSHQ